MNTIKIIVSMVLIGVGLLFWGSQKGSFNTKLKLHSRSMSEELIPISTTEWVRIPTDPSRETCEFSITDQNLKYYLVINEDFKNPHELPGNKVVEFKGVTKSHDFCLKPGQDVTNAQIRFKRIPK